MRALVRSYLSRDAHEHLQRYAYIPGDTRMDEWSDRYPPYLAGPHTHEVQI